MAAALAHVLGAGDMVVVEENGGWSHAEDTWVVVEVKAGTSKMMKRKALSWNDPT